MSEGWLARNPLMRWFDDRGVGFKLGLNCVFLVLGILMVGGATLALSYQQTLADRKFMVKSAVQIAMGHAAVLQQDVLAGKISRRDAIAEFIRYASKSRFGDDGYFAAYNTAGVYIFHGTKPNLAGTDGAKLVDGYGQHYILVAIDTAQKQSAGGYYDLNVAKAGGTAPVRKINFVQLVPGWDIVVSSGVYVDDVDALLRRNIILLALLGLPSLLLALGYSLLIRASVGGAMRRLAGTMRSLAAGDLSIPVEGTHRRDEFGGMAKAVQVFKDTSIRSVELADEAMKASLEREATRAAAEAEREASQKEGEAAVTGLAAGLAALAAGDLSCQLETPFAPRYERIRADYNTAVSKLHGIVQQIVNNTQAIGAGTSEIAQAADDLSRRTEQQAASLEQTAAALDHLTQTIGATAEGAQAAQKVVDAAKNDAEHSSVVVGDAITAMAEIDGSARQISQIIGLIDEIAFQTNLLALNAGVEAARAGDAGRGFAVVATEVRALAQRAAGAAQEIKALIATSSHHVARGVTLVSETGTSLQRIVSQVSEVHGVVAAIARSAREQATGLHEINAAMNQMDQVTQQNAAMVEQSTAATHNLAADAQELARLTRHFRLEAA